MSGFVTPSRYGRVTRGDTGRRHDTDRFGTRCHSPALGRDRRLFRLPHGLPAGEPGAGGQPEGRTGWTFLAGIAGGAGLWSAHILLSLAVHETIAYEVGLLLASFFLAIAACLAAFTLLNGLERAVGPLLRRRR